MIASRDPRRFDRFERVPQRVLISVKRGPFFAFVEFDNVKSLEAIEKEKIAFAMVVGFEFRSVNRIHPVCLPR